MPVYTQDSTYLKCPIFTHIRSISHYISTSIIVRIPNISDFTSKYLTVAGTVFNLYCLSRNDSSVYEFFDGHLLPRRFLPLIILIRIPILLLADLGFHPLLITLCRGIEHSSNFLFVLSCLISFTQFFPGQCYISTLFVLKLLYKSICIFRLDTLLAFPNLVFKENIEYRLLDDFSV